MINILNLQPNLLNHFFNNLSLIIYTHFFKFIINYYFKIKYIQNKLLFIHTF